MLHLLHSGRDEMLLLSFSLDHWGVVPTRRDATNSLAVPASLGIQNRNGGPSVRVGKGRR